MYMNYLEKTAKKLLKLSLNILSEPLAKTINDALSSRIFLDAAKIAAVSPIDVFCIR